MSIFERQVDDFLTRHGIQHEHEPRWPVHPEFNPRGAKRADWRLPDGTMVEAAGMLDDPKYAAKIGQKRALAKALDINLLLLTPETVLKLDQIFKPWFTTTSVVEQDGHSNEAPRPLQATARASSASAPFSFNNSGARP